MSTTAPMSERTVTAVLLSLWKRPESTMQQLLRDTLAPLPDVQEAVAILQQRRCLIERTPSGIRLVSTGLPCWRDILEEDVRVSGRRAGRRVMVFLRTGSTNDVAWQCAVSGENDGLLVVADEQTAGRGRLGRTWVAKAEQSILCSLILLNMPAGSIDELTLRSGLAAARAIESALAAAGFTVRLEIKWPNDILFEGRKVAGILVERRGAHVVVGIGVNVAQAMGDFPADISAQATSLYQMTGSLVDRLRVVTELLRELEGHIAGSILAAASEWLAEWKSRCAMLGSRVTVRMNDRVLAGLVLDIDPLQGLLIRDDMNAMHFLSAQVTTLSV